MGIKEAAIPLVFFVISVIGIAATAITVKTYLDTGKEKDSNFNFSAFVLAASIIGLFVSGGFAFKAFRGAPMNVGGAPKPMNNNAATAVAGSNAPQPLQANTVNNATVPSAAPAANNANANRVKVN